MRVRFIIISNELPNFRDPAMANVSRYLIIRTIRGIPLEDRNFDLPNEIIENELPAILNLAIEGRRRLFARRRFIQPSSADDLVETSKEIASPVREFIEDYYDFDPKHHEKKLVVFDCWKEWAAERNLPVGTESMFSKNLSAAFPAKIKATRLRDEKDGKEQNQRGNLRIRVYQGIKPKKIDPDWTFRETRLIEEANKYCETLDGKDELISLLRDHSMILPTSERDQEDSATSET
jgi:phage/plasmid-associated DNA primase